MRGVPTLRRPLESVRIPLSHQRNRFPLLGYYPHQDGLMADVSSTVELAASINNIESVRCLLKAGVDPNAKKDGVYTPLCSSIRDNRADIFQLLLANGADPNVPASEYPAFKCVTHYRPQYLAPLVKAGADLNSPKGILETAVQSNNTEALEWLLNAGVSPNDKVPKTGATALTTAIRENRPELVDLLLSRGADRTYHAPIMITQSTV